MRNRKIIRTCFQALSYLNILIMASWFLLVYQQAHPGIEKHVFSSLGISSTCVTLPVILNHFRRKGKITRAMRVEHVVSVSASSIALVSATLLFLELDGIPGATTSLFQVVLVHVNVPASFMVGYMCAREGFGCLPATRSDGNFGKSNVDTDGRRGAGCTLMVLVALSIGMGLGALAFASTVAWMESGLLWLAGSHATAFLLFLFNRSRFRNQYTMMKPVRKNNDSKAIRIKPGTVTARFFGYLAVILVTGCMGIAVAITTTFPASHWWYYSPQRPQVDFKYPLTILAGDGVLLAIASMVSLGIAVIHWIVSSRGNNSEKRMVSKESIPLISGLCLIIGGGTCLLIPFLYMAGVSTDSVTESLIPVDLFAGPALVTFFFGLGCLFITFRRKQVLTFILAYTFPFMFHVSKTFPSQQSAAEIESAGVYQLIGIASILIIAMILVLLSSPKIGQKREERIANATEIKVKTPGMARAAREPGLGRKARYGSIFLTLGLLSMMAIPMAGIVSGSSVQGTKVTVPATGNRPVGTPFGVNCHVFSNPVQTDFLTGNPIDVENMEKLGVGWIRSDFWWNTLFQNDSGIPDHEFVEFIDAFVANTSSIGVNIQALLSYGTPWACPEDPYNPGRYNTYPTNLSAWRDYISFCSTRWLGNASMGHFEIYNEPNNGDYWSANSTQSHLFANLTVEAAIEIKSASPANTVFGPGLSHIGLNDPRYPDDGHRNPDFLADWVMNANEIAKNAGYPNGFGDLFDAFCCHPYGTWESQLAKYSILNDFVSNQEDRFSRSFMRVNSETGCPTSEPTCLPHAQAMATAKAMVTSQLAGFDVFINYEYRDGGSLPDNYSVLDRHDLYGEHFFGLLDRDRNPKPAYYAFGTISNLLSNGTMLTPAKYHHSSGMMNLGGKGRVMHGAFTTEEGKTCIITWKDGASQETLDLKLQFAGLAAGGMNPVNVSDPENHDDRMWDFVPINSEKVQVDGSVLAINNLPLTSNVSIIIINNASTLETYTLFHPPSNTAGTWVAMGFLFLPLATVITSMVVRVIQNQQAKRRTTEKGSRKRGKMEGTMKRTKAPGTKS